ncbi:MAG: phosphatidylserine/phosphatidylglycerophosphate/cardiolipin synthase family protein [Methanobacteriaceae archaeon]|nr:phosphatidylserine/phosphatidylglycerophosphate/cardiolipin synthase family protein [Methanobacteriaceae archaeon]
MIYLLITLGGVGLLILGLYLMTFGFGIPPNFGLFLLGLCLFVAGMLMVVLFAGSMDLQSLKVETTSMIPERRPAKRRKPAKGVRTPRPSILEKLKSEIKPKKRAEKVSSEEPSKKKPKPEKPKPAGRPGPSSMEKLKSEIKPKKRVEKVSGEEPSKKRPKPAKKPLPSSMEKPKTEEVVEASTKLEKEKKPTREPSGAPKPRKGKDADFVKERLHSLKREYMKDFEGLDDVIEERLTPLRGVFDKIKAETKSSIIWSFEASDVQETMQDILTEANESIMIMYPWIRNLDTSILKKFMDTKSKVIIQEASLDDDASVELIKLLIDNNVDIRTMPHVHTVAAVADNKKGLIISTDPIYDSFEVGVIYNDKKSIKEIQKLFEKAWSLSNKISIGG